MNQEASPSPRKAAAARINGRKGGTKNPGRSRWGSLKHGLYAKLSLLEAKHLPEYGEIAAFHNALLTSLEPLSLVELVMVDNFVVAIFRLRRALRFELRITEEKKNGMMSDAMPMLLRHVSLAQRIYEKALARMLEICDKRKGSAAAKVSTVMDQFLAAEEPLPEEPAEAASSDSESVNLESLDSAPPHDASQGQEMKSSSPTRSPSSEASADAAGPAEVPAPAIAAQEEADPATSSTEKRASATEAEGKYDPGAEGGGAE